MSKGDLQTKNIKPRVKLLRAMAYKGQMVYIRMIGTDLFMYDLVFKNEIYSSNLVISPRKGQTKLSDYEIQQAGSLIWSGATTTIDMLLGTELDVKKKELAQAVISAADKNDSKQKPKKGKKRTEKEQLEYASAKGLN